MKTCMMHAITGMAGLALVVGCSKSEGGAGGAPSATAVAVPGEAASVISITGTPPVAPSASASASASPSTTTTTASAKPSGSAKALASAAASAAPPKDAPPATPLKPASTRMSGKNFTLDASSPGCRVEQPCTMTLRLAAAGEYHVNKEYPYKFTASAAPGLQFLGSGDANVFSRASGDFREDGEKAATMTVRFKPTVAGDTVVAGTYKMSVCSADQCQVEAQAVKLAVPTM